MFNTLSGQYKIQNNSTQTETEKEIFSWCDLQEELLTSVAGQHEVGDTKVD